MEREREREMGREEEGEADTSSCFFLFNLIFYAELLSIDMNNHLGCEGTWSHITHAENAKLEMFCEDQIKPLEKRQGVTTWD